MSLEGLTPAQKEALALGMQALLNGDPQTATFTKKALMKIDPKLKFPELEIDERTQAGLEEIRKENQKLRDELKEKEFKGTIEAEHERVRARGYKVEEVQKLMTDRGIVKFDTAMDVLDMEGRLATPTPDSMTSYDMPAEQKDIFSNPAKWARKTAHTLIDQLTARRRA
jgi:hypothetical protein